MHCNLGAHIEAHAVRAVMRMHHGLETKVLNAWKWHVQRTRQVVVAVTRVEERMVRRKAVLVLVLWRQWSHRTTLPAPFAEAWSRRILS